MYFDIKYTPCGCEFCIEGHNKFLQDEDAWLEGRWQDELERRNVVPMTDKEMEEFLNKFNIKVSKSIIRGKQQD